jgi:hypothetical protein
MTETTQYRNSRGETVTLTHEADDRISVWNNEWAVQIGTATSIYFAQAMGEIDVEDHSEA